MLRVHNEPKKYQWNPKAFLFITSRSVKKSLCVELTLNSTRVLRNLFQTAGLGRQADIKAQLRDNTEGEAGWK